MRITPLLIIGLLLQIPPAYSQRTINGKATASGGCSVAHSGNRDTIIIRNCGIGVEQGKKIIELLNKVLADRNLTAINSKLDELIIDASKPLQSQSNSGGVNVQQGTSGANSSILNSPITIGNIPKSISPENMVKITNFLAAAKAKLRIEIHADQYSSADPFSRDLYKAFKDALWTMAEPGVNSYQTIGIGTTTPQAIVTEKGEPIPPGQQTYVPPTDPIFYPLSVLSALGLSPTISRRNDQPADLITIDLKGGFAADR